jgi:membrane associated rhomboid family serine protease
MPPREIPVTAAISAIILVLSLVGKQLDARFGFGISTLRFSTASIFDLELWRVVTYPFVESSFFGLVLGILVFWIFGGWFESRYGGRDFLRFFALSAVGAALFAVPLSFLVNMIMPFYDVGIAEGPDPVIDAMLVALALANPHSNVLFGFVLPIKARTLVYIILGLEVVRGMMSGGAALSVVLGGMLMGYLLVTGNWRPGRLLDRFKLTRLKKRRRGLYVVPPNDKTYH